MLVLSFFSWWYGRGWAQVATSYRQRINNILDSLSVAQLSRTLFAPWKRITSNPGSSIDQKLRAWADNTFSRVIGFIVRFGVLLGALFGIIAVCIYTTVELILWPLLPFVIPAGLITGLTTWLI